MGILSRRILGSFVGGDGTKSYIKKSVLVIGTLLLAFTNGFSVAYSKTSETRMYGKGANFGVADLPPGQLRSAFESLPPQAKARAHHWLENFAYPEEDIDSIHLDKEGGVYYVDRVLVDALESTLPESADPIIQEVTFNEIFTLHSKPGASKVVHLDFDGHVISGTAWNNSAGVNTLYAIPYDTNGNPGSFSDSEIADMAAIWHRMAEDLAPFDIDVTTEPPGGGYGPFTGHVLVTHRTDQNGNSIYGSSAGGVAYVGVWGGSSYTYYQPALVFYNHLGSGNVHYVAEASSHEFGHNLSLSHDGTTSDIEYYSGHGSGNTSWAPIMGAGYYKNVTQWSNGEYAGANNTQDDIAIITNKLGESTDDHGDTWAGATPLEVNVDGSVVVTDPEIDPFNLSPFNKGVIENSNDIDLFYFETSGGQVDLVVTPAWLAWNYESNRGANLDVGLSLYDGTENLIDHFDLTTDTVATISVNVGAGQYYLAVYGVPSSNYSDYAALGQYFISGTITGGTVLPEANFTYTASDYRVTFTDTSTNSDGTIISWQWDFGDGSNSSDGANQVHTYTAAGIYSVTLTVTDDDGDSDSITQQIPITAPNSDPVAVDDSVITPNETAVTIQVLDNDSDPDGDVLSIDSVTDGGYGTVTNNGNGTVTYLPDASDGGTDTFSYTISDGRGGTDSATVSVTVNAAVKIYVSELSGSSSGSKNRWTAVVTASVSPAISGVTVSGNWDNGVATTCMTNSNGSCDFSIATRDSSVTFSVTALTALGYEYEASLDEMSSITVNKDGTVIVTNPGVNTPPSAAFSTSVNGLAVDFTDTSTDSDGSIVSWVWDFGDESSGTSNDASHVYTSAGTYTVTLTVTDNDGAIGTASSTVVVSEPQGDVSVHIGNLSAVASGNKRWTATVTISVHDSFHSQLTGGVTFSGTWSDGASTSCMTDNNGQCSVSRGTKLDSLTFVVVGLSGNGFVYDNSANEADAFITINKP